MWGPMLGNDPKTREKMIEGVAAWLPLGFRFASAWLPLGCMGEANGVAFAALYLGSDESKYITLFEGKNLPRN